MVETEKASDTLGFAFSRCRIQRDEQREYLAAKALMEREITADRDHLVVGMGSHYYYAPLFNCTELDRHAVRDAVNSAKETACRALKDAVEEVGALHFKAFADRVDAWRCWAIQRPPHWSGLTLSDTR